MVTPTQIRGQRVLLTGATGGIGRAIAKALARRGAHVTVTGRRVDVLEEVAAEIGGDAVAADLNTEDGVLELLGQVGDIDILVANAALPASGEITDFTVEQIDRALDVNLRAPIVLSRKAAESMSKRRHGHIVFISSLSGKVATMGSSLYSATKFGMRGYALGLREDLRPHGVGVSVIYPGFIRDAGMFADAGVTLPRGVGTKTPEEVASATIHAIERNRAEIDVAPVGMRIGTKIGVIAPQLAAMFNRRAGGAEIAANFKEAQRVKR